MTVKSILFLVFVFLFLFCIHFAFFRSVISLFNVTRPVYRFLLYTAMILLTFSFAAAFLLLKRYPSALTITYYQLAGVWMGYLFHFLAALAVIWILIGLARFLGFSFDKSVFAAIFLLAAAGYASFGIWNAYQPRVTEVDIKLGRELPDRWKNSTIVHLSDIHLGHNFGVRFAEKVVNQVNSLSPDVVFITGDLFDGMGGDFEGFIPILNRIESKRGIFFVTGNHEHYIGIERAEQLLRKLRLRVLDNELIENQGLEIAGVSYPGISSLDQIRNLPSQKARETVRILLFHTPTHISTNPQHQKDKHFATYWHPDTSFDLNLQLQADLQLSGHTHHGQIFPFNFLTRWLYRGHDYGLTRSGSLLIYTTSGAGSWGTPMRTATIPEIVSIRLQP